MPKCMFLNKDCYKCNIGICNNVSMLPDKITMSKDSSLYDYCSGTIVCDKCYLLNSSDECRFGVMWEKVVITKWRNSMGEKRC